MKADPPTPNARERNNLVLWAARYFDRIEVPWQEADEQANEFAIVATSWLYERAKYLADNKPEVEA